MTDQKMPTYGGQAVIEGVMMRGVNVSAIAVRKPDGEIIVKTQPLAGIYRSKLARIPFLRGLIILWDALVLGTQALTYSANMQTENDDEKIDDGAMVLTLLVSLSLAIGLFFLLPAGLAYLGETFLGWSPWWCNVAEGIIRLLLLIGYMWGIGQMDDIRRVFGYHGAEHKTINAFEAGYNLTVEDIKKASREHPRCGTAFLLTIVVLSILMFSLLGPMALLPRLLSRLLLVPVLASISYEYIRLTARYLDSPWIQPLIKPNLLLQKLTTREPDGEMIEVALASFNAILEHEHAASFA
ncbi:MAG: DUF1385 domain-containing protein [Anaerolineales bacterium]|nr:DUF1385 domain-containing protein [Anaerolineales bacterium]